MAYEYSGPSDTRRETPWVGTSTSRSVHIMELHEATHEYISSALHTRKPGEEGKLTRELIKDGASFPIKSSLHC